MNKIYNIKSDRRWKRFGKPTSNITPEVKKTEESVMIKPNKNTLLAGPWIGEFGWELFSWQGYIRKQSKNYDKTIVIGRPGHKFLYQDFCDEYFEFDPCSYKTDMCRCDGAKDYSYLINQIPYTDYISGQFSIGLVFTNSGVVDYNNGMFYKEQEFFKYNSNQKTDGYDVIFHCRNKTVGNQRNWGYDKWVKLKQSLPKDLKICCIGNNEAYYIDGTTDKREVSLEELVVIMNNSKIIVGPSSGPMHLASLSGLKHLVWGSEHNRIRYNEVWNPFKTLCIYYSKEVWDPSVESIKNLIINDLQ